MSLFRQVGIPLASTLVALIVLRVLQAHVDSGLQPSFLLAIAVSAALGGQGAGLLATLLGSVAGAVLLAEAPEPHHRTLEFVGVWLAFFVPVGLLISGLYERLHRDVAVRTRTEAALRESEESLARAQRIAHLGHWDWNIVTNELARSAEIYRIFGVEPWAFGATYPAFLQFVHPEDRERVQTAVALAVDKHHPYALDHRVVRPDGSQRIVHEEGQVVRDERLVRTAGSWRPRPRERWSSAARRAPGQQRQSSVRRSLLPPPCASSASGGSGPPARARPARRGRAPDPPAAPGALAREDRSRGE